MNLKFGTRRGTKKFHKKIEYLTKHYKNCKDRNSKQTGGHLRNSAHFDKIDAVMGCRDILTLSNVKEAGSAVLEQEANVQDQGDCVEKEEARTSRKKTKNREREEEHDNEDRKMFQAAFAGLETQRKDMNAFVNNLKNTRATAYNNECFGGGTQQVLGKTVKPHAWPVFSLEHFIEHFWTFSVPVYMCLFISFDLYAILMFHKN